MRQGSLPGRAETPQGAPSRSDRARSPRSGESPTRADDLFAKVVELRKQASAFRRFGYMASADALDQRADRCEASAEFIRGRERAEAGRALGLSQSPQLSRRP